LLAVENAKADMHNYSGVHRWLSGFALQAG
jgi:hypothetical protein